MSMDSQSTAFPEYTTEAVMEADALVDIRVHGAGKTWRMWGRNSRDREMSLAAAVPDGVLPVLMGAGLGHCLRELARRGPVAVIDREKTIRDLTGAATELPSSVTLITEADPNRALQKVLEWRETVGRNTLHPVRMSLYQRLAPEYYGFIAERLEQCPEKNFWQQAQYPKFRKPLPRILFFRANYFLSREIENALERMGVECASLPVDTEGVAGGEYIEKLLKKILEFRPDFILTVNHFGLDREGKITELLERMGLPLASWFVDNPHLILHEYTGLDATNVALFTYDAGTIDPMTARGFRYVQYLPLGTDPDRFKPGLAPKSSRWESDVSFVGNSMTAAVRNTLHAAQPSPELQETYSAIAREFGASRMFSVKEFLAAQHPDVAREIDNATSIEQRLALESLITWEATRQYRTGCVNRTLQFTPLIVGDAGWQQTLPADADWHALPRLDYYQDLPAFYPCSKVNFNCTSLQMKGAVNQRVFDVPACGAFLLTDSRHQMDRLFDPGSEVVSYNDMDEIPELIAHYLQNDTARRMIATAARKRILGEHTYRHRLQALCATMRTIFA